jgi:hypothetical protein
MIPHFHLYFFLKTYLIEKTNQKKILQSKNVLLFALVNPSYMMAANENPEPSGKFLDGSSGSCLGKIII